MFFNINEELASSVRANSIDRLLNLGTSIDIIDLIGDR